MSTTVGAHNTANASPSFAHPPVTTPRNLTSTFFAVGSIGVPGFAGEPLASAAISPGVFRWFCAGTPISSKPDPQQEISHHV
ncbi:hypothetical protein [Hydrogenophaga sp. PAMC20947]|uniref:hypothetical protein n=1 Tax=Hydrogenophaga sp. PAMC20947 TaxID=2565558 RepID=UPI001B34C08D|nr:hypothetical protein [Hydrogenophaga sp. PAMC20947]